MNRSRDELTIDIDEVYCVVCDTKMDWNDEDREWVCPNCGNRAFQDENSGVDGIYFEHGPDDIYDEVYHQFLEDDDEETEEYYDPEDMDPSEDGF